jgi:formate C-acetyltransferase
MHRLRIPCNIALRVHEGMDQELLRRAVAYLFEDGFGVTFACSKGLDEGFARNGFPIALARTRIKVGCNWTALPGIEYPSQDVTRVSLVKPMLLALDDVLALPDPERSMEALWERYAEHLGASVDVVKLGRDLHMERHSRNYPEIVINLFCYGTIERGLDVAEGGVSIVDLSMDGVGLATAADSFAAIEQRVVRERRLTWEELAEHLRNDFAGAENVRLMLANVPHYGHGGERADYWAMRIGDCWSHAVHDQPTPNGWRCIPGLFSHGNTNDLGRGLPATPNGRRACAPISHNADPDPGFLPGGLVAVTNKFNAVAEVQPKWGNTTPLQIEMDKHMLGEAGGVDTVVALINTHNAQGGTLINMNVLSREDVIEAHRDPMTHPDLVVRVTGYSAYFKSLSREYRQPIVDRILAEA